MEVKQNNSTKRSKFIPALALFIVLGGCILSHQPMIKNVFSEGVRFLHEDTRLNTLNVSQKVKK